MHKLSDKIKYYASHGKLSDETVVSIMEDVDGLIAEVCDCHPEAVHKLQMQLHEHLEGKHYDEHYARWRVSKMYNKADMRSKDRIPAWSLDQAAEQLNRWRQHLPSSVNVYDMYVALNAQHEDCIELYSTWFDDEGEVRARIAEAAVQFWFLDIDYPHGQDVKTWDYFEH